MNALVVGGTGPTGPYVVEGLLQRGFQVTILHRGTHEVEFSRPVEHLHSDPHFVETFQKALGNRTFDMVVAMYGRLRLIAEGVKGRTFRLIGVDGGSYRYSILGFKDPDIPAIPVPETAPQVTDEKLDKMSYLMWRTEQSVLEAHREGHYKVTLLRYPYVYGPRAPGPLEWCIMRRVLDGRKRLIIPDSGLTLVAKAYAQNAAQAVLLAVDKPAEAAGQVFNVRDERMLPVRDWVRLICKAMNCEMELVSLPYELARPSRPYSRRPHHHVSDITKIKTLLGYRDVTPTDEAIERTVRWYLEHRPEPGSEAEQELRDPFDYAREDAVIEEYRKCVTRIREIGDIGFKWRHIYDHPKDPLKNE